MDVNINDRVLTCAGVLLRNHGSDAVQVVLDVEDVLEVGDELEADPDGAGDKSVNQASLSVKERHGSLNLTKNSWLNHC